MDARLTDYGARVNDLSFDLTAFGISIAIFGVLISVVAFITAGQKARETAEGLMREWMKEKETHLGSQISDLLAESKKQLTAAVLEAQSITAEAKKAKDTAQQSLAKGASIPELPEVEATALREANQALRSKPEAAYTAGNWLDRAFAAFTDGKPELAVEYFDQAAQAPDATPAEAALALRNSGSLLYHLNHFTEASDKFDGALRRFANSTDPDVSKSVANIAFSKANTLNKLERYDDAIKAYDEVIKTYSADERPEIRRLALVAEGNRLESIASSGRTSEALRAVDDLLTRLAPEEDLMAKVTRADVSLLKAIILHSAGKIEQANNALASLIATESDIPNDPVRAQQFKNIINKAKEYLSDPNASWAFFTYDSR